MNKAAIPLKLGITGGIGSGKTSVCRVFSILGVPVFSADPVASALMENDDKLKNKINELAGKDLYTGGKLDRSGLAALMFNNIEVLNRINSLVHPLVFRQFSDWVLQQDTSYVIMEAAILFESGASKLVDRIATVVAPVEERIQRVIHRNNLTREMVTERIRNQMSDEEKISRSDYVIRNSENEMIIPAILNIHYEILNHINIQN
ncbi:MAG TPA: dephospho-CoA kinase [Bacteroidales bacterium]|nr:dephospho-CoA kinase [Bacteroidales bacterium]